MQGNYMYRLRTAFCFFVFCSVACVLIGCGKKSSSSGVKKSIARLSVRRVVPARELVTTEEAMEFSRKMEAAFIENDTRECNSLISWRSIAQKSTEGFDLPKKTLREFRSEILRDLLTSNFFGKIRGGPEKEAAYTLLRAFKKDGQMCARFRVNTENGINYHDFLLGKSGGRVVAEDLFIFMSAEKFSQTIRRSILPFIKNNSRTWLQKLTTNESAFVTNSEEIQKFSNQFNNKQFSQSLKTFYTLPEVVRKDKTILLMRYQAAMNESDDALLQAAEDIQKWCPEDKAFEFLKIDYHILRKEYDQALQCVDSVDRWVGGDPYLEFIRGNIYYEKGDIQNAIMKMKAAIRKEAMPAEVYLSLVGLSLELKDHAKTLEYLNAFEVRFPEIPWNNMRTVPEYSEFVKSPEGKQWLIDHGF